MTKKLAPEKKSCRCLCVVSKSYLTGIALFLSLPFISSCCQPTKTHKQSITVAINKSQQRQQPLQQQAQHLKSSNSNLFDFGEFRLINLLQNPADNAHILQLGDSHTAADFFTGALRDQIQQRYGNAGPGWLPPAWIRGQRSATLKLDTAHAKNWQLISSRLAEHNNFPLGGFLLQPLKKGGQLRLSQYSNDVRFFNVRMLYQSPKEVAISLNQRTVMLAPQADWQWSPAQSVQLPLNLEVHDQHFPQLGGWFVDNGRPGILFSSLGINGATINMLDKWGSNWHSTLQALHPDLVILAYGTNEAFNNELNTDLYYQDLTRHVRQLREKQPQTALLIIGTPDAIKQPLARNCQAQRPIQLTKVQAIQRQVAQEQQTLYWDWQAMMGGACSFTTWQAKGLAQKDGVHFTSEGYKLSAQALYQDLQQLLTDLTQSNLKQ